MRIVTMEVEIRNGRVITAKSESLPERGRGLLTLLPDSVVVPNAGSIKEFIARWAGSFSLREPEGGDPRLDFLIEKHAK